MVSLKTQFSKNNFQGIRGHFKRPETPWEILYAGLYNPAAQLSIYVCMCMSHFFLNSFSEEYIEIRW